jgi:acetate kinase
VARLKRYSQDSLRLGPGALAAVLGGLDTLIFTAGIGEHVALVRQRICVGLDFIGIELDLHRNLTHARRSSFVMADESL